MNDRRGGLGRGLGALIPTAPAGAGEPAGQEATGAYFSTVPIGSVEPNPRQPRDVFDEDAMAELVTSIREVGLLQPIVVRQVGAGRYQLIMGERRWRAAREAGLAEIPAIVRETQDEHLLRDALLENLHRQQLNPLEEAAAYEQLLNDFGTTHEELAARIGRSRSQVSNTMRLLRLPASVQRRVAAGILSAGHARALLGLDDHARQEELAGRIVAEGLSVRAVEELVAVEPEAAPGRQRREKLTDPRLGDVGTLLSEHFSTRVRVDLGRRKGKIITEFASMEDLHRILAVMGVDPARVSAPEDTPVRSDDGRADETASEAADLASSDNGDVVHSEHDPSGWEESQVAQPVDGAWSGG